VILIHVFVPPVLLGGILPASAAAADAGIDASDLKKLLGLDCNLEAPNPELKRDKKFLKELQRTYSFENPAEALRYTPKPTVDDLAEVGNDPDLFDKGTRNRLLASRNRYLDRKTEEGKEAWKWERWLKQFIPNQANAGKGAAYVQLFLKECGLAENPDWKPQQQIEGCEKRTYDLVYIHGEVLFALEMKAGNAPDNDQLEKDKKCLEKNPRLKIVQIFGAPLAAKTIERVTNTGIIPFGFYARGELNVKGQSNTLAQGLTLSDQLGAGSASADPAEDASETQRMRVDAGVESDAVEELGGVDFSTLELRYLSDTHTGGPGLRYGFTVDTVEGDQPSYGGRRAAQLASDAFFVWLALPPSDFTVNLNPDEPDRIIEAQFGRTDAGRVLLEADLQMKKTVAKLIHPDTPLGKEYFATLQGEAKCLSTRQWIVPEPATVRENGGELYILDAPLSVKMEAEYFKTSGLLGGQCDAGGKVAQEQNEAVYRRMILPLVQRAVNEDPAYADLRRVYVSRVAAEWYRERSASKVTAYSDIVNSGDISRWVSREPWAPRQVFDQFVKSYTDGEFNVTRTTQRGDLIETFTYLYGGVDFSNVPRTRLSGTQFSSTRDTLPTTAELSLYGPVSEKGGREVWLGGMSTSVPLAEYYASRPVPPTSGILFRTSIGTPLAIWIGWGAVASVRRRRYRRSMADPAG
jgi:hypothetical protein